MPNRPSEKPSQPELPGDSQSEIDETANNGESDRDLNNTRIGEFQLLRRLGSGGMADVYLAEQTSLGRSVAVKVLKSDSMFGSNDVMMKRFELEARAAGGLNHPNIVQILTTGREGAVSYIVQEYVPGLNLSQWIRKHGSPDYGTGLKWMQQIASALQTASEAGIVHRDVKPENIMITRNGVAKVTDFGLAQLVTSQNQKMNLTQAGTTMGTPWYMSPEQIQGEKVDHRSDLYSFGITCFHMFAGRPPFPGKNAMSVAVQHLREAPPRLAELRADLPVKLCDVIHRLIEKKPADRFQTGQELQTALQRLEHIPVNATLQRSHSWHSKLSRWIPDFRFLVPAALAVLMVSFATARQWYPPMQLPPRPQPKKVRIEESAARQFAVALTNSRSTNAWKEVIDAFPDSSEAEIAQMRLALIYVDSPPQDYDRALDEFRKLEEAGSSPGKRHLKVVGIIGQAYTYFRKGDSDEARSLMDHLYQIHDFDQVFEGPDKDLQLELAIRQGPQELRDFALGSGPRFVPPAPGSGTRPGGPRK